MKKTLILCLVAMPLLYAMPVQASRTVDSEISICLEEEFTAAQITAIINQVHPDYYDKFGLSVADMLTLYANNEFTIEDLGENTFRTSYGGLVLVDNLEL